MSTTSLHDWHPTDEVDTIWHRLQQHDWCCIFDVGDWRIAGVANLPNWKLRTKDWKNIVKTPQNIEAPPNAPPFLNGLLSIVSFDGELHSWQPDYTVAHDTSQNRWYFWGTQEQYNTFVGEQTNGQEYRVSSTQSFELVSNMSEAYYQRAVERTREEIELGNVYQINLSHRIGPLQIDNPLKTWLALMDLNPSTHGCYWQTPQEVLLCNSPEQFLLFSTDQSIQSTPIKGTHRTPEHPEAYNELWNSEKERAELTMIVDMMRNDISRVSKVGSVIAKARTIRQCGDLLHAEQTVQGTLLDGTTIWKAVYTCFPPASITGAPKIAAIELIEDLEPNTRGWYTGSFGWQDGRGQSEWNVLIRTIQCSSLSSDGSAVGYYNVGAGIVYDSDPALEWVETLAKGRAIACVLKSSE